jgi:hypothetical protein
MHTQIQKPAIISTRKRKAKPDGAAGESLLAQDIPQIVKMDVSMVDLTREGTIAQAAYYRAERRGFEPGHEIEDWLAAEAELGTG